MDARFLGNKFITRGANQVKFKTLMRGSWAHKNSNICKLQFGQGIRPRGMNLCQKMEVFDFWEPRTHPRKPIEVKFCTVKRTNSPLGYANFTWIGATCRPSGAKMLIFGLLSKTYRRVASCLPVINWSLCMLGLAYRGPSAKPMQTRTGVF